MNKYAVLHGFKLLSSSLDAVGVYAVQHMHFMSSLHKFPSEIVDMEVCTTDMVGRIER
jgi:hypothetical protein